MTKLLTWLELSGGEIATSNTLAERVPVLSITGAPIRSESAREGIELTIFDVPELIAILFGSANKVQPRDSIRESLLGIEGAPLRNSRYGFIRSTSNSF